MDKWKKHNQIHHSSSMEQRNNFPQTFQTGYQTDCYQLLSGFLYDVLENIYTNYSSTALIVKLRHCKNALVSYFNVFIGPFGNVFVS